MRYNRNEKALYEEAMRTVPGMLGAMEHQSREDGQMLLAEYFREAMGLAINPCTAWSIALTAALHWVGQLAGELAEQTDTDREQIAQQMGAMAVMWQTNGSPRG